MATTPPTPPPGTPAPAAAAGAEAPSANKALIAGILGVLCCAIVGIFAIIWGNAAKKEIDASGGVLGGSGKAQAGVILGWVAIVLWIVGVVISLATGALNFSAGVN